MVELRWVDNVRYYEYTPSTIVYDADVDAFTVAEADIHSRDRRYRVALAVVVTDRHLLVERLLVEAAIQQGRMLLELLIRQHRSMVDRLTADISYVFSISGYRLR